MSDTYVHIVTDSTASLPQPYATGLTVVPLQVITGEKVLSDGVDIVGADVARGQRDGGRFTTSQPTRQALAAAYQGAADQGATEVLSVHMSGALSGTARGAEIAAMRSPIPVRVLDSRTAAMGLGFAVRAAVHKAQRGGRGDAVESCARDVAASSWTGFMVDSVEHLRRGGRLGGAVAALGAVLGVRPLLAVRDGSIELFRTSRSPAGGIARLMAHAQLVAKGFRHPVFAVHYSDDEALARGLAATLTSLGARVELTALSAVLVAHVGPGALALVVADSPA